MTGRSRAREVALQLLYQHDLNPTVPRAAVEQFVQGRLPGRPPLGAFCLALFDGALANLPAIDSRLTAVAENWRLPRMAAVDRNVLRLGAYELLFAADAPPGVAINEAIELARRYGAEGSPAFVNGVLDRLAQSASPAGEPAPPAGPIEGEGAPQVERPA